MKKVMIATPMYNSMCTANYTISMINLVSEMKFVEDIEIVTLFALNESLIPKTRSMMTHSFLKSDCTHLLFIDADISFSAKDVIDLMKSDKNFVCGIYPKKKINWDRIHNSIMKGGPANLLPLFGSEFLVHETENGERTEDFVEVDRAATGMMMISRKVFEDLTEYVHTFKVEDSVDNVSDRDEWMKEYFFTSTDPQTGVFLHEDFNFCRLWKIIGGKIYASTKMKLQHVGTHVYG